MNSILSNLTITIPSQLFKQLYFITPPFSFSTSLMKNKVEKESENNILIK
jgi:hypothetical protein